MNYRTGRGIGVRYVMLAVVAVPLVSFLFLATGAVRGADREVAAAQRAKVAGEQVTAFTNLEAAVAVEHYWAGATVAVRQFGLEPASLRDVLGVDVMEEWTKAEAVVDRLRAIGRGHRPRRCAGSCTRHARRRRRRGLRAGGAARRRRGRPGQGGARRGRARRRPSGGDGGCGRRALGFDRPPVRGVRPRGQPVRCPIPREGPDRPPRRGADRRPGAVPGGGVDARPPVRGLAGPRRRAPGDRPGPDHPGLPRRHRPGDRRDRHAPRRA